MMRPTDVVTPAAAVVVVLTAILGGGFFPLPRMVVGGALMLVWIVAAAGTCGRPDRTEWMLAGLVAWGLVSALWVGSSPLAAKEVLTIWIAALLLFGICRRGNERDRRRALGILTIGAAVVAAAIVVEAAVSGLRVGGLLENPNVAVALLAPTLPVGWRVLDRLPRWRWAWSAVVVTGILCTGSRAGLLAMVVAIGLLLPHGRFRLAGVIGGSMVAAGVLVWRFVSQPDVLAWHRISIWQAVVEIWLTRPVTGIGPGSLLEAASAERILHADEIGRYQFVISYAESTPLAVLVQIGLVGLGLAILTLGVWWLEVRRDTRRRPVWLTPAVGAIAVLAAFHDLLTIDPVVWWWAVLVGCVGRSDCDRNHPDLSVSLHALRWFPVLMVSWVTAWGMVSPAYSRWVWQRGEPTTAHVVRVLRIEPWLSLAPAGRVRRLLGAAESWTWAEAAEALSWARTAVDVHPGRAALWADLGRVHVRILSDLGGTDHDIQSARRALIRACELDPHLPWHWLERARLDWLVGDVEQAINFTRRALQDEPNTIRGWLFLSRLEFERGHLDAARAALDEATTRMGRLRTRERNEYELELLLAPAEQLRELRSILGGID